MACSYEVLKGYFLTLLLIVVQPSLQEFQFIQEPESYYYTITNYTTEIGCKAILCKDNETSPTTLNAAFFRNSIPVVVNATSRHELISDNDGNVIGLMIRSTKEEDSLSVYSCVIESDGQTYRSANATLYVGDGRPFSPIEPPYQMSESLRSIMVEWGSSPVPKFAPITMYMIKYWPHDSSRDMAVTIITENNDTSFELMPLSPGQKYFVEISGINIFGNGTASTAETITTGKGEVPPAPDNVNINTVERKNKAFVSISWRPVVVEADCMTPVDSYLIYIESSSVDNQVVEVPVNSNHVEHGPMIMHELILNVSGQYRVGVAARNGAGESDVTYFEKDLNILQDPLPSTDNASLNILLAIVITACILLVLFSSLIFLIIFRIRYKMQKFKSTTTSRLGSKSPTSSTASKSTPYDSSPVNMKPLSIPSPNVVEGHNNVDYSEIGEDYELLEGNLSTPPPNVEEGHNNIVEYNEIAANYEGDLSIPSPNVEEGHNNIVEYNEIVANYELTEGDHQYLDKTEHRQDIGEKSQETIPVLIQDMNGEAMGDYQRLKHEGMPNVVTEEDLNQTELNGVSMQDINGERIHAVNEEHHYAILCNDV